MPSISVVDWGSIDTRSQHCHHAFASSVYFLGSRREPLNSKPVEHRTGFVARIDIKLHGFAEHPGFFRDIREFILDIN